MDLQELLKMNIEIANLINAPQVNLPPIIKGLVQKLQMNPLRSLLFRMRKELFSDIEVIPDNGLVVWVVYLTD